MITVSSYEAKTHLPELLRKVREGTHIVITRHNHPIAFIVPAEGTKQQTVAETIQALKEFRQGKNLLGKSIKSMIEEGRK